MAGNLRRRLEVADTTQAGDEERAQEVGVARGVEIADVEHGAAAALDRDGQQRRERGGTVGDDPGSRIRAPGGDEIGDLLRRGGAIVGLEVPDLGRRLVVESREGDVHDADAAARQLLFERRIGPREKRGLVTFLHRNMAARRRSFRAREALGCLECRRLRRRRRPADDVLQVPTAAA